MAGLSLGIDLSEIRSRVAFRLHGTRDYSALTTSDQQNVDSVIKSGLRRFYYPLMTDPNVNHRWTFLKPEFRIHLQSGTTDYMLDARIGGLLGNLSYVASDQAYIPVESVSVDRILQLRSRNTQIQTFPFHYATRWIAANGLADQRLELLVYPDPDGLYTLKGRARIRPEALTEDNPVPWGGPECAEAILQSCLAVAEQQIDNEVGSDTAAFRAALSAAIQWDQANTAETGESLGFMYDGYNGDIAGPELRGGEYGGVRRFQDFTPVSYLGAS